MNLRLKFGTVLAAAGGAVALLATPASASVEGPTWVHGPHTFGSVQVEDHTGDFWPVTASTSSWGSGYHYGRCYNSQCVRVYETDDGDNGVVGETYYDSHQTSAGQRFSSVTIYMNDFYGRQYSSTQRQEAITHELGHALGLGHDSGSGRGVMYSYVDGYHTSISTLERTELSQLYLQ